MRAAVANDTFRISITFQLLPCSTSSLAKAVRYGGMGPVATEEACDEGSPTSTFSLCGIPIRFRRLICRFPTP
jgi:hypothetical protein